MKGISLSRRIFALAFINLALLLAVFLAIARFQYQLDFDSFLFAPARDRLDAVASDVALELEETPAEQRTGLMGRYAASYGADFYLFETRRGRDGRSVARKRCGHYSSTIVPPKQRRVPNPIFKNRFSVFTQIVFGEIDASQLILLGLTDSAKYFTGH